jgi:hypothetical protein
MTGMARGGCLCALRRLSFLAPVFMAVILFVAFTRAEALARAVGDEDVCSAMSFASVPPPPSEDDPTDLSSHRHACCDLGLCLDGSVLGATPPTLAARARHRHRVAVTRPSRPTVGRRRAGFRPRDPPSC